jgi:hypothetical protein
MVGAGGTILKTSNGGNSWLIQSSGTINSLNSVHFTNAQNGWAVGNSGTLLKTSDGGSSWQNQSSGTIYPLYSVHFTDPQNGWTVGNFGNILKYNPIPTNTVTMVQPNLEVKLYPNPLNNGLLNLECEETCALAIYDAAGKLRFEKNNIQGLESIPLVLKPGFYFAQVVSQKGRQTIKLVVDAN